MNQEKSEFKLIEWISRNRPPAGDDVLTDIGDDMAILRTGGDKILITTDILLEGVHFDLDTATLAQVGYKAMACSLSDCAAMAAIPFVAVVAVALPNRMSMSQAQQLHQGLQSAAVNYHCPIVGGDTTSWDNPLAIDIAMLAKPGKTDPVLRSGAQIGDIVLVTGRLGGSLLSGRHLDFTPRVAEAQLLTSLATIHAMIDISDGLSSDLNHICLSSDVAAVIDEEALPLSSTALESADPLYAALADGEDFELLFCVKPADAEKLLRDWPAKSPLEVTRIGEIVPCEKTDLPRMFLRNSAGRLTLLPPGGWEHFRD